MPIERQTAEEAASAFQEALQSTPQRVPRFLPFSRIELEGRAFTSMVRFTKWLASKGVTKTAGAAAERLSARLSLIAVLGAFVAALSQPNKPASTRANVPIEILRTTPAPLILLEPPANRFDQLDRSFNFGTDLRLL